jgi:hypothetical protein
MVSSEVQRTLVKSPPELWAELSDPAALARHLGELGEIRITRVEPEQKVEWEADETSGTVLIDPSGWGTRVTLTATREIPEPEAPRASDAPTERDATAPSQPESAAPSQPGSPAPSQPDATAPSQPDAPAPSQPESTAPSQPEAIAPADPDPSADAGDEAEPVVAIEGDPAFDTGAEPAPMEAEPELQGEPEPALEDGFMPALEPRRGFFARLFRRHTAIAQPSFEPGDAGLAQPPEPPDAFAAVTRALAPETFAAAHPFATTHLATPTQPETQAQQAQDQQANDISAEIRRAEDVPAENVAAEDTAAEEVTAVLTSVLDRLGAAHHRPFSRA